MARENQGLQIALIIFVMTTVILAVTTFIFVQQYKEAVKKADDLVDTNKKTKTAADNKIDECNQLKAMMGFAASEELQAIELQFNKDMETYAGAYEDVDKFYRPVVAYLADIVNKKNLKLDEKDAEIKTLKEEYAKNEQELQKQIAQFQDAANKAGQDLAAVDQTAKAARARELQDQQKLQQGFDTVRKKAAGDLADRDKKIEEISVQLVKVKQLNEKQADELEEIRTETFEVPDGEIRWVNQRSGTVWVNLGRADALQRQITFSVYPADTTNLANAGKKASIEVTQILGEHLAEARIVEDTISDPVMPGDRVHTPVWSPGEQRRFALAGFMDIDDDGKSDQHLVRSLITMSGGVVDCETDPDTGRRSGKMTINTRYLVLGEAPTAKGQEGVIAGYTRMIGDAEQLGIQKISVGELLQAMGYKNQTPVKRFGLGANPNDFRAKPPEGVPRVSGGNVSDLFRHRRPPANKPAPRGGAYR